MFISSLFDNNIFIKIKDKNRQINWCTWLWGGGGGGGVYGLNSICKRFLRVERNRLSKIYITKCFYGIGILHYDYSTSDDSFSDQCKDILTEV